MNRLIQNKVEIHYIKPWLGFPFRVIGKNEKVGLCPYLHPRFTTQLVMLLCICESPGCFQHQSLFIQFNMVFHAEFQVIIDAMNWSYKRKCSTVNIYSESPSSIIVVSNLYTRYLVVIDIILKYRSRQRTKFRMAWVKGHVCLTGNVLDD